MQMGALRTAELLKAGTALVETHGEWTTAGRSAGMELTSDTTNVTMGTSSTSMAVMMHAESS